MKRSLKIYNGISASTPVGMDFRLMPFLGIDFLRGRHRPNARENTHLPVDILKICSIFLYKSIHLCKQLSHIYHLGISCTSKVGCRALRRTPVNYKISPPYFLRCFYYPFATFQ